MHCPACGHLETKVTDSRVSADGATIRRRRECLKCGFRFSTLEEIEILGITVVKRDGRREPYHRDKIVSGLQKALEKRPTTTEQLMNLVRGIETDIQRKRKPEITSIEIGEMVMEHLKRFDKVAYIRFASVYRSFEDAETFHKEVRKLLRERTRRSFLRRRTQ